MPAHSAGLLVHRRRAGKPLEVLLVHPGGPYWSKRDDGSWSIPKGELAEGEDALAGAEREFAEELGIRAPPGPRTPLGEVVQSAGKRVTAWAVAGDVDTSVIDGCTFELEWPPRSGKLRRFPEVDRAAWYTLEEARVKLLAGQLPLIDRLVESLTRSK